MPALTDMSSVMLDRALAQLAVVLDKAKAHCAERKIDEAVLLGMRLYPDMFALTRQVQTACDFSKFCVARIAGIDAPKFDDDEKSFDDLLARIARTRAFIAGVPAAQIDGQEHKPVTIKMRERELHTEALPYVQRMVLPNVFFHCATAYGILRHAGVPLGKADFIGAL